MAHRLRLCVDYHATVTHRGLVGHFCVKINNRFCSGSGQPLNEIGESLSLLSGPSLIAPVGCGHIPRSAISLPSLASRVRATCCDSTLGRLFALTDAVAHRAGKAPRAKQLQAERNTLRTFQ